MSAKQYDYPSNEDAFEDLVADLIQAMFNPPLPATRYGRRGQRQDGVDITWVTAGGEHHAAQCKFYIDAKLTKDHIDRDLSAAHSISPPLQKFIFATTKPRDRFLKDHARSCVLHGRAGAVDIWFWEDIEQFLSRHEDVAYQLVQPKIVRHMGLYLRKEGLALVPSDFSGIQQVGAQDRSALAEETTGLLSMGRLSAVIERLTAPGVRLSDDLRLTLARAYFQCENYAQVIALADEEPVSARLLALAGYVHAIMGMAADSSVASARAHANASQEDLPYITALNLSAMRVRDSVAYEAILQAVPPALSENPLIRGVLGDAAQHEGLYDIAITHYEAAIALDLRPNVLRRMALLAARLSRTSAQLPLADFTLRQPELIKELGALRDELRAEDNEKIDASVRGKLLHNLGVASMLLGDGPAAVEYARSALRLVPENADYWVRYGFTLTVFGFEMEPELMRQAPLDNAQVQLMLADIEYRNGNAEAARNRIESALALPQVEPDLKARLEAQRIVVQGPAALDSDRVRELLAGAEAGPCPNPFLLRVIGEPELSLELTAQLLRVVASADFTGMDVRERVALAGALVERGLVVGAVRFLPDLRDVVRFRNGPIDPSVAGVLLRVLLAARRLDEAETLSGEWCIHAPENPYARSLRTRILLAGGEVRLALEELLGARAVLAKSAPLLGKAVALARVCGCLHEARRVISTIDMPRPRNINDNRALWFALTAIQEWRRLEELALVSLQPGTDLGSISGELLHLTATMRASGPSGAVRENCKITVAHPQRGDLHYWVGSSPPPIAGLGRGDWLNIFLGLKPGVQVVPASGPYMGVSLTLTDVKPALTLFHEHAQQQGLAEGQLHAYQGNPSELIDQIREMLQTRREATQRSLEIGAQAGMPAVVMASVLSCSPRQFLHSGEGWVPRCHRGGPEDFEREDCALKSISEWVVDGVTICLIVEAELETMFPALGVRLYVTKETCATLREWYLQERENLRAMGIMSAGDGGRVNMQSFGTRDRSVHRAFWLRVKNFVDTQCMLTERAADDVAAEFSDHVDELDVATVSSLAAAKAYGRGFLSDEMAVRQGYAQSSEIESASLRPFLMRWFRINFMPGKGRALAQIRAMARLASYGRVFQSIPIAALHLALYAGSHERREILKALLSTLRTAEPRAWLQGITLIAHNHLLRQRSLKKGMDPCRLIPLVLKSLPTLPKEEYRIIADYLEQTWRAVDRRTRRSVTRWLRRRAT